MATSAKIARVTPALLVLISVAMISLIFSDLLGQPKNKSNGITNQNPGTDGIVAPIEDGVPMQCPAVFVTPAVEHHLQHILRHLDRHQATFKRRQALANRFMDTTVTGVRSLSPLLAGATLLRLGSAYEGTHVSPDVDFDGFVALNESLLLPFELEYGADGYVAARLRQEVTRQSLPTELSQLLTSDGYLDARGFKRWVFTQLGTAIRLAAVECPELRVTVSERRQVVAAELDSEEGRIRVDFPILLLTPKDWRRLRSAALRPCGIDLVPNGLSPRWYFFSDQLLNKPAPDTQSARWFKVDSLYLEQDLLLRVRRVRKVARLLKAVSKARQWSVRFRIQATALKRALLWTYAAGCEHQEWQEDSDLAPAMVASLHTVLHALRRHRLDCFWTENSTNLLYHPLTVDGAPVRELINEITEVVNVLASGDLEGVRQLFHSACQNKPFWKHRGTFA